MAFPFRGDVKSAAVRRNDYEVFRRTGARSLVVSVLLPSESVPRGTDLQVKTVS